MASKPTIYIGADHAGFDLKTSMREHLEAQGRPVEDVGAHKLDPKDDYPQYGAAVAKAVREHPGSLGVLSCGNAEGVCIVANKFEGIRAGIGYSTKAARTMRTDDNANIICIPGRIKTQDDPLDILDTYLDTNFSEAPRHKRRINQVREIDEQNSCAVTVVPAILEHDEEAFRQKITNTRMQDAASLFQVDVLDGSMFDQTAWADAEAVADMQPLPDIELHLMVANPLPVISAWKQFVPTLKRTIFHIEAPQPMETLLKAVKSMDLETGLAINPETDPESVKPFEPLIDVVLVLGVQPGKSGQAFLGEPILEKLCRAGRLFPGKILAVDGGVNAQNAKSIVRAGANQLCAASSVWNAHNPVAAFHNLKNVLS